MRSLFHRYSRRTQAQVHGAHHTCRIGRPRWLSPRRMRRYRSSDYSKRLFRCCSLIMGRHHKTRHFAAELPVGTLYYAIDFFFAAHRAFIIADNFFRMAALIGLRPAVFLETAVAFFGADLPFHFAQRCFIAAEIRLRAAGLIRRRFLPVAGLAWLLLGGRPLRAGWESSPVRAAIACSIRLASCLSCATTL